MGFEFGHADFAAGHEVDGTLEFIGALADLGLEFFVEAFEFFSRLDANDSGGALVGQGLEKVRVVSVIASSLVALH